MVGNGPLPVVQRPGPVLLQQPRQCTIREKPTAGLAYRTVVALVVRIHDALDRSATDGARLAEPAMYGHAVVKRGHFFRERVPGLGPQARDPVAQGVSCGVE